MRPIALLLVALLAPLATAVEVVPEDVAPTCIGVRRGIPPGITITPRHCLPDPVYLWEQVCDAVQPLCHDALP